MFPAPKHRQIASGAWSEDVSWEFYLAEDLPPEELCTAVFCLALHDENKVVLTKTKRGWEMLGGHLEPGETIEQALFREAHEEGGYTPQSYRLFGYRKIISKRVLPAPAGRTYPFPVSYIPHFVAKSSLPLEAAHGEAGEILDTRAFFLSELKSLSIKEILVVESGLNAHESLL